MNKRNLIILEVVLVIAIGYMSFLHLQQPSQEEALQVITDTFPALVDDGKPIITIDSISRHNGRWYIVTIKSTQDTKDSVPVKVLLVESKRQFSVVAGPDIYFPEDSLNEHGVPESVILELQK